MLFKKRQAMETLHQAETTIFEGGQHAIALLR
jgi:hypothetical protein